MNILWNIQQTRVECTKIPKNIKNSKNMQTLKKGNRCKMRQSVNQRASKMSLTPFIYVKYCMLNLFFGLHQQNFLKERLHSAFKLPSE